MSTAREWISRAFGTRAQHCETVPCFEKVRVCVGVPTSRDENLCPFAASYRCAVLGLDGTRRSERLAMALQRVLGIGCRGSADACQHMQG
jgi:hypothetical protein